MSSKKVRSRAITVTAAAVDVPMIPDGILQDKHLVKRLEQFRDLILDRHEQCIGVGIKLIEKFVCCGELLAHARAHIGRGSFENWIADTFARETGLGIRTAQRYMRAYRGFVEYLKEHNAAPPPGSLAIVTNDKESLLAYCKQVIAIREAETKTRRRNAPRPLGRQFLDFIKAFFGKSDLDEVSFGFTERTDVDHGFADARSIESNLQTHIDAVLRDLNNDTVREVLLLTSIKAALSNDSLWQFPLVIVRESTNSSPQSGSTKNSLPSGCVIFYLSLKPDFTRFAMLGDIGVAFVPLSSPHDPSQSLTLQCERPTST